MTAWAAVHLLAAASGLTVVGLALSRGERSPLRRPLALLAASQFAWNAASVGSEVTHYETYALLGAIAAPLFPVLMLHFVLTFLGRRNQLRWVLIGAYVVFGAQSLVVLAELIIPGSQIPNALGTFATGLLITALPLAVYAVVLLSLHLRKTVSQLERTRTRMLLLAIVVVPVLLSTDLLADLGLPVPRMATLGAFTFNLMVARLTLGLGLFTSSTRRPVSLGQALILGLFFAVSYLAIFSAFGGQLGVLIISFTALSLVLAVIGWLFFTNNSAEKAGLERFAALGRFSAQMAHDLRNPLSAARTAADVLSYDLKGTGESEKDARAIVSQIDRVLKVIERYQRLSKLEPQFSQLDANELVTKVLTLQHHAAGSTVTIEKQLATPSPQFFGDADLLASAIENLVKNAVEAMPNGGTVTVSTEINSERDEPRLVLSVKDTGIGFDARAREQAFEMFVTTKQNGSGLGLAFVRQIARAHGGDALLTSREGAGTTVSLTLPLTQVPHG